MCALCLAQSILSLSAVPRAGTLGLPCNLKAACSLSSFCAGCRWTALFGCALGMTQLILITGLNEQWGIRNEYFVLGDSVILTVLGQVSFMPVLVLAARSCPEVGLSF